MKAIIIGAGLSGLSLAQALSRAGASVTVFERDRDSESRGQGYRLTIDEIGSNALRDCLPDPNYQFIRSTAGIAKGEGAFIFVDRKARELHRFTFDLEQAEQQGRISGQVDRRTLRQALIVGIEKNIQWGKQFSHYEETSGGVTAHFEDGSSQTAEFLVGADGNNSRVRKQRLPDIVPVDKGKRAIFGLTPLENRNLQIVDGLLSEGGVMSLGPRGRVFFCTAMRFREQPTLAAQRFGLDIDMAHRDDYAMWAITISKAELGSAGDQVQNTSARLHEIALAETEAFAQDFQSLVECGNREETVLVPLRGLMPSRPWRSGRVTLVGDAIHVMPPFGAHGANTALRDSQMLASRLCDADIDDDVVERIGVYEKEMRSYATASVREAVRMMSMTTAAFPFKQTVFRTVLKLARR